MGLAQPGLVLLVLVDSFSFLLKPGPGDSNLKSEMLWLRDCCLSSRKHLLYNVRTCCCGATAQGQLKELGKVTCIRLPKRTRSKSWTVYIQIPFVSRDFFKFKNRQKQDFFDLESIPAWESSGQGGHLPPQSSVVSCVRKIKCRVCKKSDFLPLITSEGLSLKTKSNIFFRQVGVFLELVQQPFAFCWKKSM